MRNKPNDVQTPMENISFTPGHSFPIVFPNMSSFQNNSFAMNIF